MGIIYEEVKSLSESYVRAIEALDAKAATLFGFAAVIIGISASLSPYVIDKMGSWTRFFFLLGTGVMAISALLSFWAYRVRMIALGPDVDALHNLLEKTNNVDKEEVFEKLSITHFNCIYHNIGVLAVKRDQIKTSFWAGLLGISILIISVIVGIFLGS